MYITKYNIKKTTPSKRNKLNIKLLLCKTYFNKYFKTLNSFGSNVFGKKVTNKNRKTASIKKIFPLDYLLNTQYTLFTIDCKLVIGIKRNYKKICSILKTSTGVISITPKIVGILPGDFIMSLENIFSGIYTLYTDKIGLLHFFLRFYGIWISLISFCAGFFASNIGLVYPKLARSCGTSCLLFSYSSKSNFVTVILPSKIKVKITNNWFGYLGKNEGFDGLNKKLGKYSINYYKGFKPVVRGVAKNPVDHPHGGRCKTNQPEVSPWSNIAKVGK